MTTQHKIIGLPRLTMGVILTLLFMPICSQMKETNRIGDYNPHLLAFAYDTVQFESVQNQWYMLSNPTHDAFVVSEALGFHYKQDTVISECDRLIQVNGYFRASGPVGVANRVYEYRIRVNRSGVDSTVFEFNVSSSGLPVLREIPAGFHTKPGDKLWGEIRTTSSTGLLNFYGGMVIIHCID